MPEDDLLSDDQSRWEDDGGCLNCPPEFEDDAPPVEVD